VPFGALWAPSCALREQSGDKMWDFPTSGEKKGALSTITCPKSTPWLYIYIYIYIISSSYIYNISLDLYDFLHILQVIPLAKCYGIYSTFGEILRGTPLDVIKFQCDSHILQGGTPCPMWENPFLGIQWHPKGHPLGSPWISMNCIQFTDGTPCNT